MKFIYKMLLRILAALTLWFSMVSADPIISFFMRPYPEHFGMQYAQEMTDKLAIPGKIARKNIRTWANNLTGSGVISTYAGYLGVSDTNGQTQFPRRHSTNKLYIAITPRITPITMTNHMVHHWEFETGTPAELFVATLQQDPETDLYFWEIQQTKIPINNVIPREAITIIAKPKYIVIPIGATVAHKSPHLLLPDLYIKKALNKTMHALYVLNIEHFLRSVSMQTKQDTDRYRLHIPL